jgi:hypothetical protein
MSISIKNFKSRTEINVDIVFNTSNTDLRCGEWLVGDEKYAFIVKEIKPIDENTIKVIANFSGECYNGFETPKHLFSIKLFKKIEILS